MNRELWQDEVLKKLDQIIVLLEKIEAMEKSILLEYDASSSDCLPTNVSPTQVDTPFRLKTTVRV